MAINEWTVLVGHAGDSGDEREHSRQLHRNDDAGNADDHHAAHRAFVGLAIEPEIGRHTDLVRNTIDVG